MYDWEERVREDVGMIREEDKKYLPDMLTTSNVAFLDTEIDVTDVNGFHIITPMAIHPLFIDSEKYRYRIGAMGVFKMYKADAEFHKDLHVNEDLFFVEATYCLHGYDDNSSCSILTNIWVWIVLNLYCKTHKQAVSGHRLFCTAVPVYGSMAQCVAHDACLLSR